MVNFAFFSGTVTMISNFPTGQTGEEGCYQLFSVVDGTGSTVNFVISPTTYCIEQAVISTGDRITGYYDANAPVPLIYPPQFRGLIVAADNPNYSVKAGFFNSQLLSSDGMLKLNIAPYTQVLLTNGQPFTGNIANRNLIVVYGPATKSIPAQTTPYKVIVWCNSPS
ncbi:hypothetical protein ACOJQI_22525 [Bacillus salacetis]|uniref:hypothetical protein n=1 Tax=Bacillus salacetis TaxID=2315464 RepID=UPI003BA02C8B